MSISARPLTESALSKKKIEESEFMNQNATLDEC